MKGIKRLIADGKRRGTISKWSIVGLIIGTPLMTLGGMWLSLYYTSGYIFNGYTLLYPSLAKGWVPTMLGFIIFMVSAWGIKFSKKKGEVDAAD